MRTEELVTTNIRLPKNQLRALKQEALQKEKSVGFLLRELIRMHVQSGTHKIHKKRKITSIWDLPKLAVDMGDSTLASHIDDIVYGNRTVG
ncbi:MAG: hypothetical protein G01um101429_403 [Parcubacteria group bacterium Gr01-1014_29]|nr:MAG: hypothetical protein G01um101429_403 [Parcubacteria group bacterium Gr01-1014_29]